MHTVKCKNTRNENNQVVTCNRFLKALPDCVVAALKANPGEKMFSRCPTCPGYQRWIEIYYDVNRGMVIESTSKPSDFGTDLEFDTIINSEQVG
jgi:hypothetical protein